MYQLNCFIITNNHVPFLVIFISFIAFDFFSFLFLFLGNLTYFFLQLKRAIYLFFIFKNNPSGNLKKLSINHPDSVSVSRFDLLIKSNIFLSKKMKVFSDITLFG